MLSQNNHRKEHFDLVMKKKEFEKFYSGFRVLSFGTSWIFIVGNRTAGKSFFWKWYAVKRFIEHGEQFVYVRRYKNDLKKTVKFFFSDIGFKFEGHKLFIKGRDFFIDNQLAGTSIALTEAENYKSATMPNVKIIIFDEFLNKNERYLGGRDGNAEVDACLNLYQTIARGDGEFIRDDVRFVFISNAMSVVNPYFLYFGIDRLIQKDTRFLRQPGGKKGWVLEMVVNENAKEAVKESKFGDLIEGTEYARMALDNEFFLDNDQFVEKAPKSCRYQCSMKYAGRTFGLWADRMNSIFYVNEKYDPSCKIIYSLDNGSHTVGSTMANRSSMFFKCLKRAYESGQVRFSSQLAKNAILLYLKL